MPPVDPVDPGPPGAGREPPAIVSLLAGQLDATGYPATLLDLAARGWFELGAAEPGQPMCLLPPASPDQPLAPYQQRAALHLVRRAAGRGEVPAAALAEGFAEGQTAFAEAFHDEVAADARRRGLIKPGLWSRMRRTERLTEAGAACLAGWQHRVARGDATVAYAAALGAAPAAVTVFTRDPAFVWSCHGGRWRRLAVGVRAGRRAPRSAEIDAVVLERRSWVQRGGEYADTTRYGVLLDDGQRSEAWSFEVDRGCYARLVPGTLVHATVNPRRNTLRAVTVTGMPQLPPQVAAEQAARLPLAARAVTADEAARVLGVAPRDLQCYLLGWSCVWRHTADRRSVTITAGRRALLARHAERTGRPLPAGEDVAAWLVGRRSVVLRRDELVVKVILTGRAGRDAAAALIWLAGRVAERLVAAPGDARLAEDEWAPAPEG